MVKQLYFRKQISDKDMSSFNGRYFDESHYSDIIDEDCDGYDEDGNLLFLLYLFCYFFLSDATWNTCLSTINTNWFKNDIVNASSNLKFWQSLGCTIAFVYSTLLSFHIRLIIVGSSLVLGVIGFLFAQMLHNNKLQNEINEVLRNGIKADR